MEKVGIQIEAGFDDQIATLPERAVGEMLRRTTVAARLCCELPWSCRGLFLKSVSWLV